MPQTKKNWVNQRSASSKLIFSIALGLLFYFFVPGPPESHIPFSWDIFCLSMLTFTWITFFTVSSRDIRSEAQKQDGSRAYIFILSLLAAIVSMFSVIQMILSTEAGALYKTLNLTSGISCMILSWGLIHTIFTIRYTHFYYARDMDKKAKHAGGLDFPTHPEQTDPASPDFLDFAYFAFTIGMTFQVSDVEISNPKIRQLVLLHGLFSFAFNAAIIALSVNIISGIIQN